MMQLGHKSTDLDRYIYLVNLLDHDETLFYRTVMSDPARFLPIVYDPTIGEACLKFGHIYRQTRGMYLSINRRGKVKEVLRNWPQKDVRFICVTDGGRILGLGDLGANGAGIPIGKLQLYTACAGVPPQYLLPMYLDAGTNNEQYLHDPLYLGMRKTRPPTEELYSFVDEFVEAVQEVFPKCCIHFEDWTGVDAVHLLQRYRDKYCVYNDDVQGTAGITLAGMINAAKLKGTKLKDEKYLFLGAGSAGIGLADLLVFCAGRARHDAERRAVARLHVRRQRPAGIDPHGPCRLPEAVRAQACADQGLRRRHRKHQAHNHHRRQHHRRRVHPEGVETMSRINERPVILALVEPDGARRMHGRAGLHLVEGQGDLCRRRAVSHRSTTKARHSCRARPTTSTSSRQSGWRSSQHRRSESPTRCSSRLDSAVADQVAPELLKQGLLYPLQSNILETEIQTAARVAKLVFDSGLARVERPADMVSFIRSHVYKPEYPAILGAKATKAA